MGALVIGALLTAVCLWVVCQPFLRRRQVPIAAASTYDEAVIIQDAALEELKTLEAEFAVGELDEVEYHTRRDQLRVTAAKALRDQDRLRQKALATSDRALEEEVLAVRRARSGRQGRCQVCNAPLPARAVQCSRCGTPVAQNTGSKEGP